MTFNRLKELLLEGAPDAKSKKMARAAMTHHSYTSFSFRITWPIYQRRERCSAQEAEDMIVGNSLSFYTKELPRFLETGTFDNNVSKVRCPFCNSLYIDKLCKH